MYFRGEVHLAVQKALLGQITPELRVVAVETNMRQISIRVYHDGPAADDLFDELDVATTEVYAAFPGEGPEAVSVVLHLIRVDGPDPIPVIGTPIFSRKGVRYRPWTPGDPG